MKRKIKKKSESLLNKQTSTNDKSSENKTSIKLFQRKKLMYNTTNNSKPTSNHITINFLYLFHFKL